MNKSLLLLLVAVSALGARAARAEDSLEAQLQGLSLPANQAPTSVTTEKLYSVQPRFVSLKQRSELSLGGGKNFAADSFLVSNQVSLNYRFHLSDRWNLMAGGTYVFNSLSSAGEKLRDMNALVPDTCYVKYRAELLGSFNLFYGKFRIDMDKVFYFDQYLSVGPGLVVMDTATAPAAVADVGFAFWFGRNTNVRLGLKDYHYKQQRRVTASMVNDLVGHLDIGILLGGDES